MTKPSHPTITPADQSKLTCAIIGCGQGGEGRGGGHSIGYAHAKAYAEEASTRLVAACARNPAHRTAFAADYPQAKMFADYREMLVTVRPQVVSICAYPQDRLAMVEAALAAGAKIIWAEKPLTLSLAEARRIESLALERGARVFVDFQRRYGKPMEDFAAAVRGERIGKLLSIDVVLPCPDLINFGIHLLDLALYALGDRRPVEVQAAADFSGRRSHQGIRTENSLIGTIKFHDGVRLTFETAEAPPAPPIIRAQGTEGHAELHVAVPAGAPGILRARFKGEATLHAPAYDEHFHHGLTDGQLYYRRVLADILNGVRLGNQTRIDVGEAVRGTELMVGLFASAKAGRRLAYPLAPEHEAPLEPA
jgi:predicted dehydrogenase